MATSADGAESLNFGYVAIAPNVVASDSGAHSAGTPVVVSEFVKNASLPISNTGGASTGADAATTQMIPSRRPTIGPFSIEMYRSKLAGKTDAILKPLADSGGEFWVIAAESASGVASATNPVHTFQVHSLDGYSPLMIDTDRTDAATVAMTAPLSGGYETAVS